MQSKGTLVSRRLPSELNRDAPTGVFISAGLTGHMRSEGNSVFIDSPKARDEVRFVAGGHSEFDLSGIAGLEKHGIFRRCDVMYSPMVVEVAAPGMFDDFASFMEAVLSNDADVKHGRLQYRTVYGEALTVFTGPDRIPLINVKRVD